MTKAELIAKLADDAGTTKVQAEAVLKSLTEVITDSLKQGDKLTVPGIGIFSTGQRAAREGRNPQTGEKIQISAATTVKFKVSKPIKDACN